MDDLISRQDAIKVVEGIDSYFVKYIEQLPSAQPEIIRCRDCKHSYDAIGGSFCSFGVCADCIVDPDFYCANAERKDNELV